MRPKSEKWKKNCLSCGKEMVYQSNYAMQNAISGLCKSCFLENWNRFSGKTHSNDVKITQSKKISGEGNPMFGKKHSPETVKLIREKRKQQITSDETRKKISNAHKGKIVTDETKSKISKYFKNRYVSDETKTKMSQSRKRYFENMSDVEYENYCDKMRSAHKKRNCNVFPSYNKNSIKLIEEYGKEHGYTFQHAENGGEYCIETLGYWVDAYDKEKNVVLEVDEKHHFVNGKLRECDVLRQKRIEKHLKCKFIRLKI